MGGGALFFTCSQLEGTRTSKSGARRPINDYYTSLDKMREKETKVMAEKEKKNKQSRLLNVTLLIPCSSLIV